MALSLLLLPAIGGFWFLTHWNLTRYQIARDSGYQILLKSALVGAFLYILSIPATEGLEIALPTTLVIWSDHVPDPYTSEVAISIVLAILAPPVLNLKYTKRRGGRRAAIDNGDQIGLLIDLCMEQVKLVEVSLRNRKSYVGFAFESGIGRGPDPDIILIPTLSGYRDRYTHKLNITVDYSQTIREYINERPGSLSNEDLHVVIPASEIVSARRFIPEIYDKFQDARPRFPSGTPYDP